MATYKVRGVNSHNIIYWYSDPNGGKKKQHWEAYETELEAMQRKAYIDILQKKKLEAELFQAAMDYKSKREKERKSLEIVKVVPDKSPLPQPAAESNTDKTYREFQEKWLPVHARLRRFSPNSYDSYRSNLDNHILPYFGDRIMSTITSEEIDDFMDYLSNKPCRGPKSFRRNPDDIPKLSSGSVKKCYTVLTAGFPYAKKWRYITEIPETTAPIERTKKRKFWDSQQIWTAMESMQDDNILRLAVHLAFVGSLRAGETTGIKIDAVNFQDRSLWITQEVQRVSDEALEVLPENEIIFVFPKDEQRSKSSLILKTPKTEGSVRNMFLPTQLLIEIRERLKEIQKNKDFFGSEYKDYGLLICKPDGRPIDPKDIGKWFKQWQYANGIKDKIEFQGLRKSGQMSKIRITNNNYQVVSNTTGQSVNVMLKHYDEALETEKRTMALLIETNFYPQSNNSEWEAGEGFNLESTLKAMQENPDVAQQILQLLLSNAVVAAQ